MYLKISGSDMNSFLHGTVVDLSDVGELTIPIHSGTIEIKHADDEILVLYRTTGDSIPECILSVLP